MSLSLFVMETSPLWTFCDRISPLFSIPSYHHSTFIVHSGLDYTTLSVVIPKTFFGYWGPINVLFVVCLSLMSCKMSCRPVIRSSEGSSTGSSYLTLHLSKKLHVRNLVSLRTDENV